ncbi:TPA: MazG-like family protein [Enterobacter hormaechei]|nr:MazG-like family protein [Enterobacter hormaechei]HED5802427.1 MazG-like family protein [Enterobacter hormaechei]HED5821854.1 MazG-like family protein [Enterobacter hormaechei]
MSKTDEADNLERLYPGSHATFHYGTNDFQILLIDGESFRAPTVAGVIEKVKAHYAEKRGQTGMDLFDDLVEKAKARAEKAAIKFPQPNYVLNKFHEEAGEVGKEVIHYTENRGDWARVEDEIVDLLAMTIRLLKEGDGVIGFIPPYLKGGSHD